MEIFSKIEAAVTEKTQMEDFVKGYIEGSTGNCDCLSPFEPVPSKLHQLGYDAGQQYDNFGEFLKDVAEEGGALDEIIELNEEYNEQTGSNVQLCIFGGELLGKVG